MTAPDAGAVPAEEEAAPIVAVTRTIGGVLLVIVGGALVLAGAFWYFLVPFFGWATEGFWNTMAEWADLGGVAVGVGGFILLVIGGALIQRARRRRFQLVVDPAQELRRDAGAGPTTLV